jgi:hypothetical protein
MKKNFIKSLKEMVSSKIYRDKNGKLYRKVNDKLQAHENGVWRDKPISFEVLSDFKLREY